MSHKKRLLLLARSQPLPGAAVRINGQFIQADKDGQADVELPPGVHSLEVHDGRSWHTRKVRSTQEVSLLVVDATPSTDGGIIPSPAASLRPNSPPREVYGERYACQDVLGRGGMSVVLRARDQVLNRTVALKMLSDELQENTEAQRIFMSEARHLAQLNHPNLVSVHDIGQHDSRVFMVLEYVKGENMESLAHRLGGLQAALAVPLMIQLAQAVGYLHGEGLIHRDLKPGNAILQSDGKLKLIDFGLARHFEDLAVRSTRVRGTPAYMSPEQIKGGVLSPASDVYQLGATFYELLAGRLPFEEGDVAYAHVHQPPPSIHQFVRGVPEPLADLIDLCLRKDPAERPPHGQAVAEALAAIYSQMRTQNAELPDLQNWIHQLSARSQPFFANAQPSSVGSLPCISQPSNSRPFIESGKWTPIARPGTGSVPGTSPSGLLHPSLPQQAPLAPPQGGQARSTMMLVVGALLGILFLGGGLVLGATLLAPKAPPVATIPAPVQGVAPPQAAPAVPAAAALVPAPGVLAPSPSPSKEAPPAEAPPGETDVEEMSFTEKDIHAEDMARQLEDAQQLQQQKKKPLTEKQKRLRQRKAAETQAAARAEPKAPPAPSPSAAPSPSRPALLGNKSSGSRGGLLPVKNSKGSGLLPTR